MRMVHTIINMIKGEFGVAFLKRKKSLTRTENALKII